MRWRKRVERSLKMLRGDVNDLSFCTICWATVWEPHKRLHQQWHDIQRDAHRRDGDT